MAKVQNDVPRASQDKQKGGEKTQAECDSPTVDRAPK